MNTTQREQKSWNRYRCWKILIAPFLGLAAFGLLYNEFQPSLRWYVGLAITACLGLAYVAEEVFRIVRNQGKPCANCGASVQLKAFRIKATCSHCGADL